MSGTRTSRAAARQRAPRRGVGAVVLAASVVVALTGCGAFSEADEDATLADVERANREEGDVEGQVGDTVEVYDLRATVTEVRRVAEYGEIDNRGYVEVTISMENPTSSAVDYDRSDWRIEKPDGTISNTANVSTEEQLLDDVIPAGGTVEGRVIFSVGQEEGQFAILFSPASLRPDDPLGVERGVWVFESAPEEG
ncbi:DUF4352 domain-containing protein [Actinomarinicola tropica]|uniref:DUF4352 domain-containing protein n=1 Tax=Actinomarinicola tropica TaxID=2789776 RepID=A0A5Q2RMS6_9ACTN|nr:DUF4352 domain-containing protein [Actinomarinicola tropica]QGG95377.1 DUF4352 domain-containing protein [Actinomarinicola tropica]